MDFLGELSRIFQMCVQTEKFWANNFDTRIHFLGFAVETFQHAGDFACWSSAELYFMGTTMARTLPRRTSMFNWLSLGHNSTCGFNGAKDSI